MHRGQELARATFLGVGGQPKPVLYTFKKPASTATPYCKTLRVDGHWGICPNGPPSHVPPIPFCTLFGILNTYAFIQAYVGNAGKIVGDTRYAHANCILYAEGTLGIH